MVTRELLARSVRGRWISRATAAILVALVVTACVRVDDPTYGIALRNECSTSTVVAVVEDPDDAYDEAAIDGHRVSLAAYEEMTLAVGTEPKEVFVVVLDKDLTVRLVVSVKAATDLDEGKFVLEGEACGEA